MGSAEEGLCWDHLSRYYPHQGCHLIVASRPALRPTRVGWQTVVTHWVHHHWATGRFADAALADGRRFEVTQEDAALGQKRQKLWH